MSPKFLPLSVVLLIHHDQVNIFGGLHGMRDRGVLESALGQAQQTYAYTQDLHEAAAQYCVSIAKNHPVRDGYNRTAADCMLTFMVVNNVGPTLSQMQLFEWTLKVALGELDRPALAALLREHSRVGGK